MNLFKLYHVGHYVQHSKHITGKKINKNINNFFSMQMKKNINMLKSGLKNYRNRNRTQRYNSIKI